MTKRMVLALLNVTFSSNLLESTRIKCWLCDSSIQRHSCHMGYHGYSTGIGWDGRDTWYCPFTLLTSTFSGWAFYNRMGPNQTPPLSFLPFWPHKKQTCSLLCMPVQITLCHWWSSKRMRKGWHGVIVTMKQFKGPGLQKCLPVCISTCACPKWQSAYSAVLNAVHFASASSLSSPSHSIEWPRCRQAQHGGVSLWWQP